jgi:hypothetical protein
LGDSRVISNRRSLATSRKGEDEDARKGLWDGYEPQAIFNRLADSQVMQFHQPHHDYRKSMEYTYNYKACS